MGIIQSHSLLRSVPKRGEQQLETLNADTQSFLLHCRGMMICPIAMRPPPAHCLDIVASPTAMTSPATHRSASSIHPLAVTPPPASLPCHRHLSPPTALPGTSPAAPLPCHRRPLDYQANASRPLLLHRHPPHLQVIATRSVAETSLPGLCHDTANRPHCRVTSIQPIAVTNSQVAIPDYFSINEPITRIRFHRSCSPLQLRVSSRNCTPFDCSDSLPHFSTSFPPKLLHDGCPSNTLSNAISSL